jgi:ADP-heptose:LPS heptosyltransferase
MAQRFKKQEKKIPLSLKDFYNIRNRVLFLHNQGGLGDLLMHRMIFQDCKKTFQEIEIFFAHDSAYKEAIIDHPEINCVDETTLNLDNFLMSYETSVKTADRYENTNTPCSEHRSDIWAKYCGIKLENHDMQFNLNQEKIDVFRNHLKIKDAPIIIFCPISKMTTKTLLNHQIKAIVEVTKDHNLYGLHTKEISELSKLNIKTISEVSLSDWMHYIAAADYVISVDTAAFHMAGGLKKPLLGIFTFADGKAYGKYFDFVLVQKHRDDGNWDCGPCYKFCQCIKSNKPQKPCLTEITKEELQFGVLQMFEKWKKIN